MPENAPTVPLCLTAKLINDHEHYSTGFLTMTVVSASITETGMEGGWIGADPGCGIAIRRGSRTWKISALDIYRALAAQDDKYLADLAKVATDAPAI